MEENERPFSSRLQNPFLLYSQLLPQEGGGTGKGLGRQEISSTVQLEVSKGDHRPLG